MPETFYNKQIQTLKNSSKSKITNIFVKFNIYILLSRSGKNEISNKDKIQMLRDQIESIKKQEQEKFKVDDW